MLLVVCTSMRIWAQEVWYSEQFMSESGLLQNRVHDMVMDEWGALLIGTEGGLVRFDGQRFRQVGVRSPEGMKPTRVLEILLAQDGGYVVRDAGCRLYLFRNGTLTSITGDAPSRQYLSRFTGAVGTVAATVKAMDPDSTLERKKDWLNVVRVVSLPDGKWCLRNNTELLVYKNTELVSAFPLPPGRSSHLLTIGEHMFLFDRTGAAHMVDPVNGMVSPVRMNAFPRPEFKGDQLGWKFFWNPQDRSATMVAADQLYRLEYEPSSVTITARLIPVQLPAGVKVGALVWIDGHDSFALGTDNKGLFIYRRQYMRNLLCDGLSEGVNNAYNAQALFGEGEVITSARGGARIFNASGCTPTRPPMAGFNEGAILRDHDGRYWYGRGDSLLRYDPARDLEEVLATGLKPLCFFEESGVVWIGAGSGVHRMEQGQLALVHPLAGADLSYRPIALCRTPTGHFWMATCAGVFQANPNGGWALVDGLDKVCARALTVVDDMILVGTYGSGAFVVKDGRTLQLPHDERGFLSHVHAFMPDSADFLWMSTNQGLFRLKRADLGAWTQDTTMNIHCAYYGKNAGLSNSEFNGGCSPPYVRTADGWASFPTMDGLAWFRPEEVPDAYPTNEVLVESVSLNGAPWSGVLDLPADHKDLVITFSLTYWGDPANAQVEYTLEDGDAGWVVLSPRQRELHFTTLPAGRQVLRIRKVGAVLRGDASVISMPIRVEAPLYRRPWFILVCVLGSAILFYGAVQLNASRLRHRNAELERKVADRTRELVEANTGLRRSLEMKEMLVSIISHDIVTPLRFIARVAGGVARRLPADTEKRLSTTLSDLANSSEKLHANAQGLLNWVKRQDGRIELRPRNVVVHLLVDEVLSREHERAVDHSIRLENLVPLDDMVRTDRNVLSIIVHNAVANAVTHSGADRIVVNGEFKEDKYRLVIKDNGSGMPASVRRHVQRVLAHGALGAMDHEGEREVQGLGLLIIADLMQLLGGQLLIESQEGQGTVLILDLLLDRACDPVSDP